MVSFSIFLIKIRNCLDSLKVYFNYRKIKKQIKINKKQRIFKKLKENLKEKYTLIKYENLYKYVFNARQVFKSLKLNNLKAEKELYNFYLVKEFKNKNLLKKIFKSLKSLFLELQEKKKNPFM